MKKQPEPSRLSNSRYLRSDHGSAMSCMDVQIPLASFGDQIHEWSEAVPVDLELRLQDTLSYATATVDDVWTEIREWLVNNETCPGIGIPCRPLAQAAQEPGCRKYVRESLQMGGQTLHQGEGTSGGQVSQHAAHRPVWRYLDGIAPDLDTSCVRLFAEAEQRRRIVDLENAVIDYAMKFGVSAAARIAMGSPLRR